MFSQSQAPAALQQKQKGQTGIRYITEDMMKHISKCERVEDIKSLNLTLSKEGGKKIKYIENLEKLKKLESLNLSFNLISKMEKLEKVNKLRELNLSFNSISKIENIESLVNLQVLNLSGNNIEHIPVWLGKKLKMLRVFKIAKNQIQSLNEMYKLRPLKDLTQLVASDNPLCQLPHYRAYLVFHLSTLEVLDGKHVSPAERNEAYDRFEQERIEDLEQQLEEQYDENQKLIEAHNKSAHEIKDKQQKEKELSQTHKDQQFKIKNLVQELSTKNDLLKKKTAELTRACQKHYELEQELAFFKIDSKFDSLGQVPIPENMNNDILEEESPYLGKARYKHNRYAFEEDLSASPQTARMIQPGRQSEKHNLSTGDLEAREKMQKELDKLLAEKHSAIQNAQSRLQKLNEELVTTQQSLKEATDEFKNLHQHAKQAMDQTKSISEDDKKKLRSKLAKKIGTVNELRNAASQIEEELQKTKDEIRERGVGIAKLREQLKTVDSDDPLHKQMKKQMTDQEQQMGEQNELYAELKQRLEEMLSHIARETADIQRIEEQLRAAQVAQNESMKAELEGIVTGLQGYLKHVQEKANQQKQDYEDVLQDRESLRQRLQGLHEHLSDQKQLQKRIRDMEASLQKAENDKSVLRQQLSQTRASSDAEERLAQAERDAEKLRQALTQAQHAAQLERNEMEERLQWEQERLQRAVQQAKEAGNKEEEARNLAQQLASVEAVNRSLKERITQQEKEMKKFQDESLNADDVQRRVQDLVRAIKSGQVQVGAVDRADFLGRAFGEVQNYMQDELDKMAQNAREGRDAQVQNEAQIQALHDRLAKAEEFYSKKAQREIAARLENENDKVRRLEDEIQRLRRQLLTERPNGHRRLQKSDKKSSSGTQKSSTADTSPTTSSSASSSTSTNSSSTDWQTRKQELYDDMSSEEQTMFDELQDELEELRRALKQMTALKNAQLTQGVDAGNQVSGSSDSGQCDSSDSRVTYLQHVSVETTPKKQSSSDTYTTSTRTPSTTRYNPHRRVDDPVLRQTADELAYAQDEIDRLNDLLSEKNQQLQTEMKHADQSHTTITTQQEELEEAHHLLQEQRNEIVRLNDQLHRLKSLKSSDEDYQSEIEHLQNDLSSLRSNLAQHGPHLDGLTVPKRYHTTQSVVPPPSVLAQPVADITYGRSDAAVIRNTADFHSTRNSTPQGRPHQSKGLIAPPMYPQPQHSTAQPYQVAPAESTYPLNAGHMGVASQNGGYYPSGATGGGRTVTQAAGYVAPPDTVHVNHGSTVPITIQTVGGSLPTTPKRQATAVMMPLNQSTPVTNARTPEFFQAPEAVPTPVPIKGILKKNKKGELEEGLFCNVPEHHHLEDYIAKLQSKVKSSKAKLRKQKLDGSLVELESPSGSDLDKSAVRRLQIELQERRAELEGLDLAIERQKRTIKEMKSLEQELLIQREAAKHELEDLHRSDMDSLHRRSEVHFESEESDIESEIDSLRKKRKYISDEVACVEETLAKRRAELRESDRLLQACENDLAEARQQAQETIKRYDEAKAGFERTVQDAEEIERRSKEAAVQLVKAQEEIQQLLTEIEELKATREENEKLLETIQQVITDKDTEFHTLDKNIKTLSERSTTLESAVAVAEEQEKTKLKMIEQSQLLLVERQEELTRIQKQVSEERRELELLDHEVGRYQTELELLQNTLEQKQQDMAELNEQVEVEVDQRRKEIKLTEEDLQSLYKERRDVEVSVEQYRSDLRQIQDEVDQQQLNLKSLMSSCNKEKSELAQAEDELQLRKVELEGLRKQHSQKIHDLEKTQKQLLQEQSDLEQIRVESSRKAGELDRLKHSILQAETELDQFGVERKALETHINTLSSEKALLEDSQKTLQQRIAQLKRKQSQTEESLTSQQSHLAQVHADLDHAQSQLEAARSNKLTVDRELSMLQQDRKEEEKELDTLKMQKEDIKKHVQEMKQEAHSQQRLCEDARWEVQRLREGIQRSRQLYEQQTEEEERQHQQLTELQLQTEDTNHTYQQAKKALQKVTKNIEREESKLNQQEAEKFQHSEEKFKELEQKVIKLGKEITQRDEEKEQLVQALSRSGEDLQQLRSLMTQEREDTSRKIHKLDCELSTLKQQLGDKSKELESLRQKSACEIAELESIAQSHYSRANRVNEELQELRQEYTNIKQQLMNQPDVIDNEKKLETTLNELKSDIHKEVSYGLNELDRSRKEAVNETAHLHGQRDALKHKLDVLKKSLSLIRSDYTENDWREAMEEEVQQQQDCLMQLRQQMNRQADILSSQRQQSELTLTGLRTKLGLLSEVLLNSENSGSSINSTVTSASKPSHSRTPVALTTDDLVTSPKSRWSNSARHPRFRSKSSERDNQD